MKFLIALGLLFLMSCGGSRKLRNNMQAVDASAVTKSFRNVVEGVNNSYFEIKENGYFDSYRLLFDSVKNTRYAGTYTTTAGSDTILLKYFQKKGEKILGNKAIISGKNITFFK